MPETNAASSYVIVDEAEILKLLRDPETKIVKIVTREDEVIDPGYIFFQPSTNKICIRDRGGNPYPTMRLSDIKEIHLRE